MGERARLSAEGTTDGSGLAGTMPPPSNPLSPNSTHSEGGGAKVRGIDWQSLRQTYSVLPLLCTEERQKEGANERKEGERKEGETRPAHTQEEQKKRASEPNDASPLQH